MSETQDVPCTACSGDGWVWEYTARDILFASDGTINNDVPEHTYKVQCDVCLGQGHVRENKPTLEGGSDEHSQV